MLKIVFAIFLALPFTLHAEVATNQAGTAQARAISLPFKQAAVTEQQGLNFKAEESPASTGGMVLRMVEGLLLCGVLLSGFVYVMKRKGYVNAAPTSRQLRVIEKLQISGKSTLILVEREGKKLLLAVGSDRVSLVDSEDESSFIRLDQKELVCDDALELSA